jgi:hypothetical protein
MGGFREVPDRAMSTSHNHYKRLNHQTKHNDVELAKLNILLIVLNVTSVHSFQEEKQRGERSKRRSA